MDDEPVVVEALELLLAADDFETISFPSADAFLGVIDQLAPGCVLMDIRMRGRDGMQALAEMQGRGINWPVILMTGHSSIEIGVKGLRRGALDFLEKPFSDVEVYRSLNVGFAALAGTRPDAEHSYGARRSR